MLIFCRLAYYGAWFLAHMVVIPRIGKSYVSRTAKTWKIAFVKASLNILNLHKKNGMSIGKI